MKKSALEWFDQLPEPIRTQAKENSNWLDNTYSSLSQCLGSNFSWFDSPQGHKYWEDICNYANAGEFDQPTPNLYGWIPVSERLPEEEDGDEDGNVLTLNIRNQMEIKFHGVVSNFSFKFWQPLPKLPEVKNV